MYNVLCIYIFLSSGCRWADKCCGVYAYVRIQRCIMCCTHIAGCYVRKVKDFAEIIIRFKVANFLSNVRACMRLAVVQNISNCFILFRPEIIQSW